MKLDTDQVIALVRFEGVLSCFSSGSDYWFLDQYLVRDAFEKNGHAFPEIPDSFRNGLHQVRPSDGAAFLSALRSAICVKEIRLKGDLSERYDSVPSVLIDFDAEVFKSFHPEPYGFERYAGDGWDSSYADFHEKRK